MTCREIYEMASQYLLMENDPDGELIASLPPVINAAATELESLAKTYCSQTGEENSFSLYTVSRPEDDFPLPARFAPAAAYYVASRLCASVCPEAAETAKGYYISAIASIRSELLADIGRTVDIY